MNDEKRGIEEIYTAAMSSSNLRVQADVRGDADVIIAAGWCHASVGGALRRLHSEFDGIAKPRMAETADYLPALTAAALATAIKGKLSREQRRLVKAAANKLKHDHNLKQISMLLERMKSLPEVRTQVALHLLKQGAEDAEAKAVDVIRWWLHPLCPACNGTTPDEGSKQKACDVCAGAGRSPVPHGDEGREAIGWMEQCIERHRASLNRRMNDRRLIMEARQVPPRENGEPARRFVREKKVLVSCE